MFRTLFVQGQVFAKKAKGSICGYLTDVNRNKLKNLDNFRYRADTPSASGNDACILQLAEWPNPAACFAVFSDRALHSAPLAET